MIEFEYDIELENHTIKATVNADAKIWDENYGADADGNRGEMRTFIDDLEVTIFDNNGNDITEKVENRYKFTFISISEEAEEKLMEAYNE